MLPLKLKFANLPTPLQLIKFEGRKFLLKRDDLTGVELSGNKIRKLEYLIYQAKKEKAETIFTCGAVQSNHARAAVIAASGAGLKTHLFLWGAKQSSPEGNLFLSRLFGAGITYLNKKDYNRVNQIMYLEREKQITLGRNVFVIPEGGSTATGIYGYVECVNELMQQANISTIKGITVAAGTGGTAAGLMIGAAINSLDIKIYAVNVLYPAEKIRSRIIMLAEACRLQYKLDINIDEKKLVIIDGYSKEGYKNITSDKVKLIKRFARSSGIIFDPAYTAKAFNAYYDNFLIKGKGMENIFIHTGGIFGIFSKKKEYLVH